MAAQYNKTATGYPAPFGQPSYAMGTGAAGYGGPPSYPAYPPPAPDPFGGRFSRDRRFFRRIVAVVLTLSIIAGIAILITWQALRPHSPKFYVVAANVSRFNATNGRLNSRMIFNVSARNPNQKIGIYYYDMNAQAYYGRRAIGYNLMPDFYQGHKNTTVMTCPLSSRDLFLEGAVLSQLADDVARKNVKIYVKLEAWVRFKVGRWTTRHYDMVVKCDVDIEWEDNSGRLTRPRRCDVEI